MRRLIPAATRCLVALAAALVLGPAAGAEAAGAAGAETPACRVSPGPESRVWSVSAAQTAAGDLLLVDSAHERILRWSRADGAWAPLDGALARTLEGSWPALLRPAGDEMLLELATPHRIVRLDAGLDLRPGSARPMIGSRRADGDRIESIWTWEPAASGREIVACSDVSAGAGDGDGATSWSTELLRVPVADPAAFVSLYQAPVGTPLRLACRLGLPLIATLDSTAFFLAPAAGAEPVRIYRHAPGDPQARALDAFPQAFARWPDLPVDFRRDEYAALWRRIERSSLPAGLFGWEGALYLLAREPAAEGTAWSLIKIDPRADRVLGGMRLNSSASDLLIAPGRDSWAVVEKGPALSLGAQDVLRVIHLPADQLRAWRPGGTLCAGLGPAG